MASFFQSLFSRGAVKTPVEDCAKQKCSVTVFAHVDGSGIGGVEVTLQPGGRKTTGDDGLAEWPGLDPDVSYIASAALSPEDAKSYRIISPSPQNATVGKGVNHKFRFEIEALSFPRVKVTEAGTGTAIPDVGVVVGGFDLGPTDRTGITDFTREAAGIPAGKHPVRLTLRPEDQKVYEFTGTPDVTVAVNSGATFEFQVRKLARPKVKVTREDNGQAVPGVAVLLGDKDLGVTNAQGIAQLAADANGIPAANYDVSLALDKDDSDWFVWAAANPKADVQAGSTATFEYKVKPVGQIEVIVQRYDAKVSAARAKFKVDGPTPSAGLATNAPSGTDPADTQYVQKVALGDYSIQLEELQALLDAQKSGSGSIREKWRVGPDKTGIIKLKVEHRKPAKAEFTLTKLDKVQFIAFNIAPPGTYTGDPNASRDLGMRCLLMKDAVDKAYAHPSVVHEDEVLKIFMAPEFYFRGLDGAYPEEMLSSIMEQLRPHVAQAKFKNWLFCFGTGIGYLKHGETTVDYELEVVSSAGNKVRVKDGTSDKAEICRDMNSGFLWNVEQGSTRVLADRADPVPSSTDFEITLRTPAAFTAGKITLLKPLYFELQATQTNTSFHSSFKIGDGVNKASILSRVPLSGPKWALFQNGKSLPITSAAPQPDGTYLVKTTVSGKLTKGPVYILEPHTTEVFNVAFVQKGGPEGSGTGLREAVVYKETTSHIDYAWGGNQSLSVRDRQRAFYDPSGMGRLIQIHGQDRIFLSTTGSTDILAQQSNPVGSASELTITGLGGGSLFLMDGITFGLEVCKDHSENKLYKFYQHPNSKGSPELQIHLIPSWGMEINMGAIAGAPGVLVFNVDGPAGSAAGKMTATGAACPHHPAVTSPTPSACPTQHYECPDSHAHYHTGAGACWYCKSPISVEQSYYCDEAEHYTDTDTCPLCGTSGLPEVGKVCSSCGTAGSASTCSACGATMDSIYKCTNAPHWTDAGPGSCADPNCGSTLIAAAPAYFCANHSQVSLTAGTCSRCSKTMTPAYHSTVPDWTPESAAGADVPTSASVTGSIPIIDTRKVSTATETVVAKAADLFDDVGSIRVYPVMDIPEASLRA
ncbi:MAG: hypothetical protein K2X35_20865 [Bryobacteraceae bacterium]|nr:hypothetical protein [Bryobacteraceae bacterium]